MIWTYKYYTISWKRSNPSPSKFGEKKNSLKNIGEVWKVELTETQLYFRKQLKELRIVHILITLLPEHVI